MRDYILKHPSATRRAPGAPAAPPAPSAEGVRYPDTRTQPLSPTEIRELGIACTRAFAAWSGDQANQCERLRANTGMGKSAFAAAWRHNEVTEATEGRATGLRTMTRADYRTVRAHFLALAGLTEAAFAALLSTGQRRGEPVENGEQVDRAITAVVAQIARHFREAGQPDPETRAAAYLAATAKAKEQSLACGWRSWPSKARWQLYFTLRNRLNAMRGVGSPARRNKSQRARTEIAED